MPHNSTLNNRHGTPTRASSVSFRQVTAITRTESLDWPASSGALAQLTQPNRISSSTNLTASLAVPIIPIDAY